VLLYCETRLRTIKSYREIFAVVLGIETAQEERLEVHPSGFIH
jgi:hypothetical protein